MMKDLSTYIDETSGIDEASGTTNEHLFSRWSSAVQFKPEDPKHRRLMNSFVSWFKGMREHYDENLILNMIDSVEDDIRLGEI